jgi:hypothetical protein
MKAARLTSLATEASAAYSVLEHELPAKQHAGTKRTTLIITEAKRLQRLQDKARRLTAQLARVKKDIRATKKLLKGLG